MTSTTLVNHSDMALSLVNSVALSVGSPLYTERDHLFNLVHGLRPTSSYGRVPMDFSIGLE